MQINNLKIQLYLKEFINSLTDLELKKRLKKKFNLLYKQPNPFIQLMEPQKFKKPNVIKELLFVLKVVNVVEHAIGKISETVFLENIRRIILVEDKEINNNDPIIRKIDEILSKQKSSSTRFKQLPKKNKDLSEYKVPILLNKKIKETYLFSKLKQLSLVNSNLKQKDNSLQYIEAEHNPEQLSLDNSNLNQRGNYIKHESEIKVEHETNFEDDSDSKDEHKPKPEIKEISDTDSEGDNEDEPASNPGPKLFSNLAKLSGYTPPLLSEFDSDPNTNPNSAPIYNHPFPDYVYGSFGETLRSNETIQPPLKPTLVSIETEKMFIDISRVFGYEASKLGIIPPYNLTDIEPHLTQQYTNEKFIKDKNTILSSLKIFNIKKEDYDMCLKLYSKNKESIDLILERLTKQRRIQEIKQEREQESKQEMISIDGNIDYFMEEQKRVDDSILLQYYSELTDHLDLLYSLKQKIFELSIRHRKLKSIINDYDEKLNAIVITFRSRSNMTIQLNPDQINDLVMEINFILSIKYYLYMTFDKKFEAILTKYQMVYQHDEDQRKFNRFSTMNIEIRKHIKPKLIEFLERFEYF